MIRNVTQDLMKNGEQMDGWMCLAAEFSFFLFYLFCSYTVISTQIVKPIINIKLINTETNSANQQFIYK